MATGITYSWAADDAHHCLKVTASVERKNWAFSVPYSDLQKWDQDGKADTKTRLFRAFRKMLNAENYVENIYLSKAYLNEAG